MYCGNQHNLATINANSHKRLRVLWQLLQKASYSRVYNTATMQYLKNRNLDKYPPQNQEIPNEKHTQIKHKVIKQAYYQQHSL